jgi:hypothetical protein
MFRTDASFFLADTVVNVFAVLSGITTVQPHGFSNYKKSNLTDPSLWEYASNPEGTGDFVSCVLQMRWVERNRGHRFRVSQLSQAMLCYAEKEGIVLDDDAKDSPVLLINRQLTRKSIENQRAAGFPTLKAGREAERAAGFPSLKKGRETCRKTGFTNLITAQAARRASQFQKMQADVQAVNKRKAEEDTNFVAPPPKKFVPGPGTKTKPTPKVPCTVAGCKNKSMDQEALAKHIRNVHGGWTAERPFKCAADTCNKYFESQSRANGHYNQSHVPKVMCPECNRKLLPKVLDKHRREQHDVAEEDL